MTEEEAKRDLRRARNLQTRIDTLKAAHRLAWESETSTTPHYGAGGAGGDINRKGERASLLAAEIEDALKKLDQIKAETLHNIEQIEDNRLAAILTAYYINGETWEAIAVRQHYSYRHLVGRLHPQALRTYAEKMS